MQKTVAAVQVWTQTKNLLEMIRFSHTLFALPFALLAAVLAWTAVDSDGRTVEFGWLPLVGILLAMVGARSAAMAFNRLVDRHLDAQNPRTAQRHLPAGLISTRDTIVFIVVSLALYFLAMLCFWPNWLPLACSLPILIVLLGYSYAKRFTVWVHFWLGLALMLAPICAWLAIRGQMVLAQPWDLLPAVVVGLAVLFWVAGFDIIYACQDFAYDRQAQLHSIPAWLGVGAALRISAWLHVVMVALLGILPFTALWGGPQLGLGWLYGMGVAGIAGLLIYEHRLVRPDDLTRVNQAFFHVNIVVSLGLLIVSTIDVFW